LKGPIKTEILSWTGKDTDSAQEKFIENTLLKRNGTPEEAAHPVVFLLSSQASFITGTSLAVDGGRA
jgi:NAD(P)-dependent dehydrogenase (short-subunit alcohol dehydrogenase family)